MISATAIVLARAIHILAGVAWAGAAVMMAVAIVPILLRHGADGAGRWLGMAAMRAGIISGISALLTILSGIYLFVVLHAGDDTAGGRVLGAGAVAALLSLAVGILMGRPAGMKLAKMQQEGNASAVAPEQVRALQARVLISSRAALGLLALSVLAMATFRYVQALAS